MLSAKFSLPWTLARDGQGNIYMSDAFALYKLAANGTVENLGFIGLTIGILALANGTILLSRGNNLHCICRYNSPTNCTAVAGICTAGVFSGGFTGDGGPATSAKLDSPSRLAAHPTDANKYYIADTGNNRIRMVNNGVITTVAGNGTKGYGGDGGPATSAALDGPCHMAVDAAGNLFIADTYNNRIRCPNDAEE